MEGENLGKQRRGFKLELTTSIKLSDPESLFLDLKRDPKIQFLWSHQSDILRAYAHDEEKHYEQLADIALELPTGTGKTLVGLLLGEYRRRKYNQRVVYLCPTRQLAHQVGLDAEEYGIQSRVILAPDYTDIKEYIQGNAIGITTYSSLFNTHPRIKDPQVILLDDAHAAEDYIASLWSVSIRRKDSRELYGKIIELLRPEMSPWTVQDMLNDNPFSPDPLETIDMIPLPRFWKHVNALRDLLDLSLTWENNEWFAWSMIRNALQACCFYISWYELLIRPVIPPTLTHQPFAQAKQRIYMSATLGEGGELERITGVPIIHRLPIPEGWDKHSSGRRLLLFPNASLDEEEAKQVAVATVQQSKRALILTPSMSNVSELEKRFSTAGIKVLGAEHVKESLDTFTSQEEVVLILANRYDGIDLPGENCRLLIIDELPAGTNLQEQFLLKKLGAISLLRDRLRTRLSQGVGRCCRNQQDYSAVIVIGQRVFDFCSRDDVRGSMHPELQAEIRFGLLNSNDANIEDFIDLLQSFYDQGSEWLSANRVIVNLRESMHKEKDPVAEQFMKVAPSEVEYIYAMWKGDYLSALQKATYVVDHLEASDAYGYKAWWYYLAGCAAWLEGKENSDQHFIEKARSLFTDATKYAAGVSWFARLARSLDIPSATLPVDTDTMLACEGIYKIMEQYGFSGVKFANKMAELTNAMEQHESSQFEQGLQQLGKLLGFESLKPGGQSAPDAVWRFQDKLAIAFEAKSEERDSHPISLRTVRQALTHAQWVRDHYPFSNNAEVDVVIISPRSSIEEDAKSNAKGLWYQNSDEMRKLTQLLVGALTRARSEGVRSNREDSIQAIFNELRDVNLLLPDVVARLKMKPLNMLPVARHEKSIDNTEEA